MMPRIIAQPTTWTRMKLVTIAGRKTSTRPSKSIAACRATHWENAPPRCASAAPIMPVCVVCTSAISASPQETLRTQSQHDDHDHEGRDGCVILEVDQAELL